MQSARKEDVDPVQVTVVANEGEDSVSTWMAFRQYQVCRWMMDIPAENGNAEHNGEGNGRRDVHTLKLAAEYIDAAAMGHGAVKIAELTGLHINTVSTRNQDPKWQAAVQHRRDTMLGSASELFRTRLSSLIAKAFDALEELLEDSEPRVKVRAVAIALDHGATLFDKIPTDLSARPESNVDKLLQQPLTREDILAEIPKANVEGDGTAED